jgi:hypothetical protein
MRKLRKQPIGPRHDWNFSLEAGARVYERRGDSDSAVIYDLRESSGYRKRTSGDLTPHVVK